MYKKKMKLCKIDKTEKCTYCGECDDLSDNDVEVLNKRRQQKEFKIKKE